MFIVGLGFDRLKFLELNHFSGGMVFAIENLIKFKVSGAKCAEIPVTLHRDGRKENKVISYNFRWLEYFKIFDDYMSEMAIFPSFIFFIISIFYFRNILELLSKNTNSASLENIYYLYFIFNKFSNIYVWIIFIFNSYQITNARSKNVKSFFKIFKIRYAF